MVLGLFSLAITSTGLLPTSSGEELRTRPPISASVDASEVIVGQSTRLNVVVIGSPNAEVILNSSALFDIEGLKITTAGKSTLAQVIDGSRTMRTICSYYVDALEAGDYTIPAISAQLNGVNVTSSPVPFRVLRREFEAVPSIRPEFAEETNLPKPVRDTERHGAPGGVQSVFGKKWIFTVALLIALGGVAASVFVRLRIRERRSAQER